MTRESTRWRGDICVELNKAGCVDAHAHVVSGGQRRDRNADLCDWLDQSYLGMLAASACDATPAWSDPNLDSTGRLQGTRTSLDALRGTTYYQLARRGLLAVYGIDLNTATNDPPQDLNRCIVETSDSPDRSRHMLAEHIGLADGVLDRHVGGTLVDAMTSGVFDWYEYILKVRPTRDGRHMQPLTKIRQPDAPYSHMAMKIDSLFSAWLPCMGTELDALLHPTGGSLSTLEAVDGYIDAMLDAFVEDDSIVALKSAIAGVRDLDFAPVARDKAAAVFTVPHNQRRAEHVRDFENYVMRRLCAGAGQRKLPIQIHVAAGPGGYVPEHRCQPGHLTRLIFDHPRTSFDLMHAGYPHWGHAASLATRFPNVYLNLSWVCMISRSDLHRLLDSWLDQLPVHKILWSGDAVYAEETIGCYLLTRDVLLDVLAERIDRGDVPPGWATQTAKRIFRNNANELFGLNCRTEAV